MKGRNKMKRIFNQSTCWNIFDNTDKPEQYWALQRAGMYKAARRAAKLLTIRHPLRMLGVIRASHRPRM